MSAERADAGRKRSNGRSYDKIFVGIKDLSDDEFWGACEDTLPSLDTIRFNESGIHQGRVVGLGRWGKDRF